MSVNLRINRLAAGAALLAAGLLAGCGGGGNGGGGTSTPLSASATTPQGLTATLAEDAAYTGPGGKVTYTLTLTNRTDRAITYGTRFGCGIDAGHVGAALLVLDPTGTRAYPSEATCTEVGISGPVTLAPGQSVSDTFSPSGVFGPAGKYTVTADFSVEAPGASDLTETQVGPLSVVSEPPAG